MKDDYCSSASHFQGGDVCLQSLNGLAPPYVANLLRRVTVHSKGQRLTERMQSTVIFEAPRRLAKTSFENRTFGVADLPAWKKSTS